MRAGGQENGRYWLVLVGAPKKKDNPDDMVTVPGSE